MYEEDDLLPISAIQHLAFCPRQCALIHLERVWAENQLTAEGRVLHERAHEEGSDLREGVLTTRALRLRSFTLGLIGQADVVEFHRLADGTATGVRLLDREGLWQPFPVEYKRGRRKPEPVDELQLCCQALCLEEMLGSCIPTGAIFYGATRERHAVTFTDALRARAKEQAMELHQLIRSGRTPKVGYSARCESCSLIEQCMPRTTGGRNTVRDYLADLFDQPRVGGGDD